MKTIYIEMSFIQCLKMIILISIIPLFTACGGGSASNTDVITNSILADKKNSAGYYGENVLFGDYLIVGEWSFTHNSDTLMGVFLKNGIVNLKSPENEMNNIMYGVEDNGKSVSLINSSGEIKFTIHNKIANNCYNGSFWDSTDNKTIDMKICKILDTTIDNFNLTNKTNAFLFTEYISNTILISGIDENIEVLITNGTLIKNDIELASNSTTVSNGDTISIKLNSSNNFSTTVSTNVTIGGESKIYKITTLAIDNIIDDFNLTNKINAFLSTEYISNTILISGIDEDIEVLITNGTLIKNDIELDSNSTTVSNGDTISIKLNSSNNFSTTVSTNVTIGGESKTYTITTLNKLFTDIQIALENTYYISNKYLIQNDNTLISIDNGILIKNDIELNTFNTITHSGDTIEIKLLSAENIGDIVVSNILVGEVSDSFLLKNRVDNYDFLKNGTYDTEDNTFYYLTMFNDGNIDFNDNYGYSIVTLYDMDMNEKYKITSSGTKNIAKGSYIVKIYNEHSSDSMTIYSPDLDIQNNFSQLTNGTYDIEDNTFYYLTMFNDGNIDFSDNYGYSIVTLYDMDMNEKYKITSSGTRNIAIGSYIVKIYNEHSSDSMTIYSPDLDVENNFSQLTNGTYDTEDNTFYYLTMLSDGNIDFSDNYGYSIVTLYDMNMNEKYKITSSGTKNIAKGSYIVKIYNEHSSDSMTIYSPSLL